MTEIVQKGAQRNTVSNGILLYLHFSSRFMHVNNVKKDWQLAYPFNVISHSSWVGNKTYEGMKEFYVLHLIAEIEGNNMSS